MAEEQHINGFIVRIEGQLQFFWLEEDGKIINPSIPIGDTEDDSYEHVTENYVRFVYMKVDHIEGKPKQLITIDDWDNFDFSSSVKEGFEIRNTETDAPSSILQIMKDDELQKLVTYFLTQVE